MQHSNTGLEVNYHGNGRSIWVSPNKHSPLLLMSFLQYTLPTNMRHILFAPQLVSVQITITTPHSKLLPQPTLVSCFTCKTQVSVPLFMVCDVKTSDFHTVRERKSVSPV